MFVLQSNSLSVLTAIFCRWTWVSQFYWS